MKLAKSKLNRIRLIGSILFTTVVVAFVGVLLYQNSRVEHLTLAAGSRTGESYIVSAALKTVVERHHPEIRIALRETGGTVESLKLLADGGADLAVAQADVASGPATRIIAVLYDDTLQLLVRSDSTVQSFSDLRGRTIALPRSGGQFESFSRVARHFGMDETDFRFTGLTDQAAEEEFSAGRADAFFRVRALGNPSIQRLARSGRFRMVRIDHAEAMRINHPSFMPARIPAGAYLGNPPVPPMDLPSVSVHRTLLAAARVDESTVRAVTGVLIENRQEMGQEIPEASREVRLLLAQVRRPEVRDQLGPELHPGAAKYYDKDKPSFLLAHSDYVGLILTVFAMLGSWIWELRAWLQRQQKNAADEYSNRVVALMNGARAAAQLDAVEAIRSEMLAILTAAVADLDQDRLSEESFHSFRAILQIGLEEVRACAAFLQTKAQTGIAYKA